MRAVKYVTRVITLKIRSVLKTQRNISLDVFSILTIQLVILVSRVFMYHRGFVSQSRRFSIVRFMTRLIIDVRSVRMSTIYWEIVVILGKI